MFVKHRDFDCTVFHQHLVDVSGVLIQIYFNIIHDDVLVEAQTRIGYRYRNIGNQIVDLFICTLQWYIGQRPARCGIRADAVFEGAPE